MTLHALGCMYLGGMAAWTAVTTGMAWRRGGQLLLRFALVSPSWPLLVILAFTDNRGRRQLPAPPAPDPLAPYMLEAMQEVDAIGLNGPRLAGPSGPTAAVFLGTLNARAVALRDESARRAMAYRGFLHTQHVHRAPDWIDGWTQAVQGWQSGMRAMNARQAQSNVNAYLTLRQAQGAQNAYLHAQQANSQEWTRHRELMQRNDEARRRAAVAQLKACEREDREQAEEQADLWNRLWRKQQEMRRQLETQPDEDVT